MELVGIEPYYLLHAKQALYHLSYNPENTWSGVRTHAPGGTAS